MALYSEKIEALIDAALADGVLTEKEKQVLLKKAQAEGIDLDEFEMVLSARLVELQNKKKAEGTHSAPKSDKYGDVRKCPACGALVPALAGTCPECGYEFSGVAASSSSQKLAKGIADIKKDAANKKNEIIKSGKFSTKTEKWHLESPQDEALSRITSDEYSQIHSLVNSFPVPNAKNDLFDLILFLKTQGYNSKYQECLNRAKMLFPKDPMFAQFWEAEEAEKNKNRKKVWTFIIAAIIVALVFGCITLVKNITESSKHKKIANEVAMAIQSGDIEKFAENPREYAGISFEQKRQIVDQLIKQGKIAEAAAFFDGADHLDMYEIQWEYKHSDEAIDYAKSTAKDLRFALYSIGEYESAWSYFPLEYSTINSELNAETRYRFMSEVVNYILKNEGKSKAKKFIKEGSEWFRTYVDDTNSRFKYYEAKKKLDTIVNEY